MYPAAQFAHWLPTFPTATLESIERFSPQFNSELVGWREFVEQLQNRRAAVFVYVLYWSAYINDLKTRFNPAYGRSHEIIFEQGGDQAASWNCVDVALSSC